MLLRVRVGKGTQNDRVHQAENGRVGSYTKCQGEDRDAGKAWTAQDLTEGEANILF